MKVFQVCEVKAVLEYLNLKNNAGIKLILNYDKCKSKLKIMKLSISQDYRV